MSDATSTSPARAHSARDRFLSEFALALAERVDLAELLDRSVRRLRDLLDVDRVTIFLLDRAGERGAFEIRTSDARTGFAPLTSTDAAGVAPPAALFRLEPIAVREAATDPRLAELRDWMVRIGTRSVLLVPVAVNGVLRGAVAAATLGAPRDFSDDDMAFVESAVRHLSAALRQAELVAELARERDRVRVLFELAAVIHRSPTVPDLMRAALSALRDTLQFPVGGFGLLDPEGAEVVCEEHFGVPPAGGALRIPVARGGPGSALAEVLSSGVPLVVDVGALGPDVSDPILRSCADRLGARTLGFFPLTHAGRPLGLLAVGTHGGRATLEAADVETLRSLADVVSVTLDQRRASDAAEAAARAMRRSAREAQALADVSRALLTRTAKRDVLLAQVLDALVLHFGPEYAGVLLVDRDADELVAIARRGEAVGSRPPMRLPLSGSGLTVTALRLGAPVSVPDVSVDPRYVSDWPDARSELAVPLVLDGEAVGVLDLQSSRPAAFSADDVRVLLVFAERAALALKVSDLVAELERRTRVLEAVARATQLLNFRLNAPDVLSALVEETSRAFPASDGCVAYVAVGGGAALQVKAAYGLGRGTLTVFGETPIPFEMLRCAGAAFTGNAPVLLDVEGLDGLMTGATPEEKARVSAAIEGREIRQLLAAPIRVGDKKLGVIEVLACRSKSFRAADGETLSVLAEQAAIALRNARLIEELSRSNRLKDDFLANLSHEVRTPLTGIVGWAEVLLDARGTDEETRRALAAILGQAETLNRMLEDLIDLSRIENFGLELRRERVSLPSTLDAAIEAVLPSANRRAVTLERRVAPGLPSFEGDAARLKQVFWNLLANGVKFSPPGARVVVELARAPDGGVTLAVSDSGVGIDAAFLPFVFDRFRQEETSAARRFGGLGVGLSIARAIVEAHGGTIRAESEGRGRGSRFVVAFKADRSAASSGSVPKVKRVESAV